METVRQAVKAKGLTYAQLAYAQESFLGRKQPARRIPSLRCELAPEEHPVGAGILRHRRPGHSGDVLTHGP